MKLILGFFILLSVNVANAYPMIPDVEYSPGTLCDRGNPDYTEDRYDEQIPYCERNVSSSLKKEIYELYEIPSNCRSRYTIDHIIPLSLGGDNSPENLWPEHKNIKATRPQLELNLYHSLRDGKITQKQAIQTILKNKFKKPSPTQGKADCDKF